MADVRKCYLVEVGILLNPTDSEYEMYKNPNVYGGTRAYYDENQYYVLSKEKAVRDASEYVKNGNPNTYGIVSKTFIPEGDALEMENGGDAPYVEDESYGLNGVIYAVYKDENGNISPLFEEKEVEMEQERE